MSVLADIQYSALGDVNANVVQRYYPAASSTPALVFGRLIRQAQFHLNKVPPGAAKPLEDRLAAIFENLKGTLPTTFSLEEQTLFALGYYQQMAHDRRERAEGAAAKAAKQNGPSQENPE
jgi:CRISPR-associated protein Csd1